jgi:hypothetical protein
MDSFWDGFTKEADDDDNHSSLKKHLATAAVGLGTAAGAYGLLRGRGHAGNTLTRTITRRAPNTAVGHAVNKAIYGADHLHYIPHANKKNIVPRAPSASKKVEGHVLYGTDEHQKFIHGTHSNIGALTKKQDLHFTDKLRESNMLNQHAPEHHVPTEMAKVHRKLKGRENLEALHNKHKVKENGYVVKARYGANSGTGEAAYIHEKDMEAHLKGEGHKLHKDKQKLIKKIHDKPEDYIVQDKINLHKGKDGTPSEIRVHAVNGKVVPNASMNRSTNPANHHHYRAAEKSMQETLDKLPHHEKHNVMMAADVGIDHKGKGKIIELNRGANYSTFTQPHELGDALTQAQSTSANQHIYKSVTGRHSQLHAGAKGLAAGAVAAGATAAGIHAHDKNKENMNKQADDKGALVSLGAAGMHHLYSSTTKEAEEKNNDTHYGKGLLIGTGLGGAIGAAHSHVTVSARDKKEALIHERNKKWISKADPKKKQYAEKILGNIKSSNKELSRLLRMRGISRGLTAGFFGGLAGAGAHHLYSESKKED